MRAALRGSALLPGTHMDGQRCLERRERPGSSQGAGALAVAGGCAGTAFEVVWGCEQSAWEVCSRFDLLLSEKLSPFGGEGFPHGWCWEMSWFLEVKTGGAAPL